MHRDVSWGPEEGPTAVRSHEPWQGKKQEETELFTVALAELTSGGISREISVLMPGSEGQGEQDVG